MRIGLSLDLPGSKNDYVRSLLAAGATLPELFHVPDDPVALRESLRGASGLLLGGGHDVDPAHYGEPRRHDNVEVEPLRDRRELAACEEARLLALPLLAICRGMQLVNVERGGTLIQDIPSEWSQGGVGHQFQQKDFEAHEVLIGDGAPAATLRRCFPGGNPMVNSRHHQAIGRLAPGLVITALAPDGIAEALAEGTPTHQFFLAVQWHPENLFSRPGHGEIFRLFVEACRRRAAVGEPATEPAEVAG
jgi:putative glutamine amidotransferase